MFPNVNQAADEPLEPAATSGSKSNPPSIDAQPTKRVKRGKGVIPFRPMLYMEDFPRTRTQRIRDWEIEHMQFLDSPELRRRHRRISKREKELDAYDRRAKEAQMR